MTGSSLSRPRIGWKTFCAALPPLHVAGASIVTERGRQQNNRVPSLSLAHHHRLEDLRLQDRPARRGLDRTARRPMARPGAVVVQPPLAQATCAAMMCAQCSPLRRQHVCVVQSFVHSSPHILCTAGPGRCVGAALCAGNVCGPCWPGSPRTVPSKHGLSSHHDGPD